MRTPVFAAGLTLALAAPAVAAPEVVTTIKPVHSLVAGVMEGVASPDLLVDGSQSPHNFSMRPTDAQMLENADLVFWVGPDLETFLEGPIDTLAGDATSVPLIEVDGMSLLEPREGGLFAGHDAAHAEEEHGHEEGADEADAHAEDEHDHEAHAEQEHGHDESHDAAHDETHEEPHDQAHADEAAGDAHAHAVDAHIWLDPDNARLMVAAITDALMQADPENAQTYNENGMALAQQISALDNEISATLEGLGDEAWFVFHDAYHGFENHFGVEATGSFTVNPEIAPGAARLTEIEQTLSQTDASCIFSEPQFSPSVAQAIADQTGAQIGVLDPLGSTLENGPSLYPELMRAIATSLVDCLES